MQVSWKADRHSDVACYIAAFVDNLLSTKLRLEAIKSATAADHSLHMVLQPIKSAAFRQQSGHSCQLELNCLNIMVLSHQGLTKCREQAHTSVWWPSISSEIKHKVESCHVCLEIKPTQRKKTLISAPPLDRPWKRLAIELCDP